MSQTPNVVTSLHAVSKGLLPECSVGMKETRSEDDSKVVHITTADYERQGQAGHRRYKLRTVVEVTSGKVHA